MSPPRPARRCSASAVATLVAGSGVRGDRNFRDLEHDGQITLIAAEEVERFNRETGLEIGAGDPRRNVVTRGVALNELVGAQFRVGETTLLGVELCEPCATLGKRLASPERVRRAGRRRVRPPRRPAGAHRRRRPHRGRRPRGSLTSLLNRVDL